MTTFTNNSQDPRSAKASAERQADDVPTRVEEFLEQWNGTISRRNFIKGSGLLVVGFSAAAAAGPLATDASAQTAGPYPDPNFRQLDSWSVTYGQLIGGKRFNIALTGNNIDATTGEAKVKPVQDLKIVGRSPQRYDIPAKVDGSLKWAVDVKLPGMVHARNVKPPVAGAKVISIDEASVRGIPGFIRVVSKGNYVAVVCEREEQAIKASRQ